MAIFRACILPIAILSVVAAGCEKNSESSSADTSSGRLVIKLIDAGQEPRRALRYQLAAGATDTMTMAMDMDMQMKAPNLPAPNMIMPTMVMVMSIAITDKVSDNEARYRFDLTDVSVKERPGSMAGASSMMEAQLRKLIGMKGSAIVDTRGLNREANLELPPGLDAQTKQMMSGTMQNMEQLSAPFPVEAVGKGAKWELHQKIEQNGMKINQVATYELIEFDGDTGKMRATLTQRADRQKVELPGAAGADVELLDLKSSGSGETAFDLGKLVPTSTINLVSDYSMKIETMGQEQTVSAHLEMKVDISR